MVVALRFWQAFGRLRWLLLVLAGSVHVWLVVAAGCLLLFHSRRTWERIRILLRAAEQSLAQLQQESAGYDIP